MDSKTRGCIFLGYGKTTKGFRLYDEGKRRVFYSRDVVFDKAKTQTTQQNDAPNAEEALTSKQWISITNR